MELREVRQYGVYNEPVSELIAAKKGAKAVVAALNNADTDGVLLELLAEKPEKVIAGMKLAAEAVGAEKLILHVPEYAAELAENLHVEGVEVEVGIVNVRAHAEDLILHIVTCLQLAEPVEGVYVSVNGGAVKVVPASTTLRELVGDVRAVVTGYVIRSAEALDMTVGEAKVENGVVCGLRDDECVVLEVQKKLLASRKQSCGKCVFCREGLIQLEGMHKDMTVGKGILEYLDYAKEIGSAMTFSTPCSMGQKSAELPLSAIEAFRGEYEEHIKKKRCPADACVAFRKVYVNPVKCIGCAKCMEVCPTDAIDGKEGYIHMVFDNDCTKCGKCVPVCPVDAIVETTGRVPKLPDRMLRVGRVRK